jgi:uncharacterized secreted protein with C-terminal beta-propeller domain
MSLKHYAGLALVGAVAAGCSGNDPGTPEPIQSRLTLQSFTSCAELEQYVEDTAVRSMRQTLDSYKQGGGFRGGLDSAAEGAPASADSKGPAAYTTTNTQVSGVDEADFVKNDGTRIFALSGGSLYASKSWPPADLALAGKLAIEGYPSQMYLDDKDRVVVFSSVYTKYAWYETTGFAERPCAGWGCDYGYSNTTKVTVVDVKDLAAPRVIGEYYLPGSYANSRRIDSSVRVVLSDYFRWPAKVRFWPEDSSGTLWNDKTRLAAALDELKVQNEAVIRGQSLEQWMPKSRYRGEDGKLVDVAYNCSDFARSNAPVNLGLMTVATLNLDSRGAAPTRTSIVGEAGQIYASKTSLYVATPHWWWWPQAGQKDFTYVHKFDIQNPDKALYVASGGFEGHIVDQFSMDEHKGFFRVASTVSSRVPDEMNPQNTWGRIETTNRISVLGESAGSLALVGQSEDVAKGERIFSSRFSEDRAYVVTFRQVDPFFTFDVSDPTKPRRVGELKIPGFSSYIQPIDANHVLTIGSYLPEPDPNTGRVDWQQRRLQLSMFDVTDFANPVQQYTHLVGTAYGWSEAQYEHKAFNYFPQRKLLAIPFWDYNPAQRGDGNYWDSFTSEVRVFNVDVNTGISARGALSMKDIYQVYNDYGWSWYWSPAVRRSVMATSQDGKDYVYAVSDGGLRVADLAAPSTPLATVRFSKAGK